MNDSCLTDEPAASPGVDSTHRGLAFQPGTFSAPRMRGLGGGLGSGPRVSHPPSTAPPPRQHPLPQGGVPAGPSPAHPNPWAGPTPCGCSQTLDVCAAVASEETSRPHGEKGKPVTRRAMRSEERSGPAPPGCQDTVVAGLQGVLPAPRLWGSASQLAPPRLSCRRAATPL